MVISKYYNPVKIIDTYSWIEACDKSQIYLGILSPLIITSKGTLDRLKLNTIFPQGSIFADVIPNPTFDGCKKAIEFSRDKKCDGVIAIGGGSVMDTAKSVMASVGTTIMDVADLLAIKEPFSNRVPSIFIPTTHGTASEVTMWATIWDMKNKKKYSLSHTELYPDIAILDGSLTLSLPLDISLITTLDALSHGFEAIWNKNANPQSTEYAIEAICSILENAVKLKNKLNDVELRRRLLRASNMAGLAFSNTKTAAAHSISYPLTACFGIPHGIASSITILPLLKINGEEIKEPLKTIQSKLNIPHIDSLSNIIHQIHNNVPKFTLRQWGVKKQHLDRIAEQSFTQGRMDNNIIDLTKNDVKHILETIF
jgi:alcohol dehydrogenase class IV